MRLSKYTHLFIVGTFFLTAAIPLHAAVYSIGDGYSLRKNEAVNENLYRIGGNTVISGTVRGDLIALSGRILVNGEVTGDILAAGGTVDVLGPVAGDVRIAGGDVVIGGSVGGDVIIAGGAVHLLSDINIRGDMVVLGGQVVFESVTAGNARIMGGDVTLNGSIAGNAIIRATDEFVFGERAIVGADLTYSARDELLVEDDAVGGEITYNPLRLKERAEARGIFATLLGFFFALKLLFTLTASLIFVLVFRRFSNAVAAESVQSFGRNTLIGFIAAILIPVVFGLLFATLIGILLGAAAAILYVLLWLLGIIYAGVVAGTVLSKWIKKIEVVDWKWTVLGVLVLQLLSLIPIIGWIIVYVFNLVAIGTLSHMLYREYWLKRV